MKLAKWIPIATLVLNSPCGFAGGRLVKPSFHIEGGEKNMREYHGSKDGVAPTPQKPLFEMDGIGANIREFYGSKGKLTPAAMEEFIDVRAKASLAKSQHMGDQTAFEAVYGSALNNERAPIVRGARITMEDDKFGTEAITGLDTYTIKLPPSNTVPSDIKITSGFGVTNERNGHAIDVDAYRKFKGFSTDVTVDQRIKVAEVNGEPRMLNLKTEVAELDKEGKILRSFLAQVDADVPTKLYLEIFDGKKIVAREFQLPAQTAKGEAITGNIAQVRPNPNLTRLTVITDTGQEIDFQVTLKSYYDEGSDIKLTNANLKTNHSEFWEAARAELTHYPSQRTGSAISKSKQLGEGVPGTAAAR